MLDEVNKQPEPPSVLGAKTSGNQVRALQNEQIGDRLDRKVGEQRVTKPRPKTRGSEQGFGNAAATLHRGGTDKLRVPPESAYRTDKAAPLQLQHADITQQDRLQAGQLVKCLHAWLGLGLGLGWARGWA